MPTATRGARPALTAAPHPPSDRHPVALHSSTTPAIEVLRSPRPGQGRPICTEDDVRRLAADLPGVTEGRSLGTPGFSVAGMIFGRMHKEPGVLVCWRENLDERDALLAADPEKFFTTDHDAGHRSLLVRLDQVEADELAELLQEAWEGRAPQRPRREPL